jgi:uncharacterized protein
MSEKPGHRLVSRRRFTAGAAGAALLVVAARERGTAAAVAANTADERQKPDDRLGSLAPFESLDFHRRDLHQRVRPLPLRDVTLTEGPFDAAASWNRAYLLRLLPDRLIHNFRVNAGLPSSAPPLGGWEAPDCELRGHFTGHYLSACALQHASTGDQEFRDRGEYIVAELAKCQRALGGSYLSAFPLEFWDRLAAGKHVWAPFYTLHKIMAGLLDMHLLAGSSQALQVLTGMADWVDRWTAPKTEDEMQAILRTEYGGMNEVLYSLSAAVQNDHWARVGDRFTKKVFFAPLALRRDELQGLHANTHIPEVIGAARRYELSGDPRFNAVCAYFWEEVATARSYATGGTSNGEHWLMPPGHLAAELRRSVDTAECCCVYNMLKLTRHLYAWSGDPRYFDYYERVLVNHRLGAIRPDVGHTQYYLSLTPGAWRTFNTEEDSFWCCTGTGAEEFSKLMDSIYWHDETALYVNLFIPSRARWRARGFTLQQETQFPEEERIRFRVTVERPVAVKLCLRVPSWVSGVAALRINGRSLEVSASAGSYAVLDRHWISGDTVELMLPMALRAEPLTDDPGLQAFLYGPVVLAADLGTRDLSADLITGSPGPRLAAPAPAEARPADEPPPIPDLLPPTIRGGGSPGEWLYHGERPLEFRTANRSGALILRPFNTILDRRYGVYLRVASAAS